MPRMSLAAAVAAMLVAWAGPATSLEWNVSLWGERRAATEHVHRLAELVSERTAGDFTLNIDYGGLSKSTENLDGLSLGAFEMAQFCSGYHPDKNPTLTVLELPYLGTSTLEEDLAVSRALYDHPAAQQDMARWNARILMPSPVPRYNLIGRGESRRTLEEFQGVRIGAVGGLGMALEAIGAVPVRVTAPDAREALATKQIEALTLPQHAHLSYGTLDQADWWTDNLDLGALNCPVAVNVEAYEALTQEQRDALDGSVDEALEHYMEGYHSLLDHWDDLLVERGVEKVSFSEEEAGRLRESAAPIRTQWIADMTARGAPGQEIYELVQQALRDFRANQGDADAQR